MEIKDYLHLYLGSDYQWKDNDGEWRRLQRLTTYQLHDITRYHIETRLILRQLSSMTEEEKDLLLQDCGEYFKDNRAKQWQFEAWSTKYLLSKSFDLFNLIENGLAIDLETIKQ